MVFSVKTDFILIKAWKGLVRRKENFWKQLLQIKCGEKGTRRGQDWEHPHDVKGKSFPEREVRVPVVPREAVAAPASLEASKARLDRAWSSL